MQHSDFGPGASGHLSEIAPFWGGAYCFDPDPLPPTWEFPADLWPVLNEANKQLMLLEGIGRSLPNPAILLRPLRDREAILSSRMEGTMATPRQLLLYELDPREAASEEDPRNMHREVANYARALDYALTSPLPTGLTLIRQLHAILMDGVRGKNRDPGQFRRQQVAIGAPARYVPPAPGRLQDFLDPFDAYLHLERKRYDPLVDCFVTHYQLEAIHPFSDGNGRIGRLLLTLMIQRCCGMTQPWLHMSEYYEADHQQYCDRMYRVSTEGAWSDWIGYCLKGVAQQATKTIERCDRLRTLRDEYYDRLTGKSASLRLKQIIDGLFKAPMVAIADLPEAIGVTYPTAKSDVAKLVKAGVLAEFPDHHPKTYYAPEIFAIAYEGLE
ncbi:Adenosine monophosphate-protein transferase SoFic [Botrimarina colliarenosi]|uniref:Adenosine monophosphate-protein transferase SoFic n=1 Tax=Botrimarina colliarenosi TaxID=2528001 RepID=A0A5C6A620_9BACT|nr:Fic/DOC family N-terminal domain-containing protein [Botrimarina colliarenosi]TWT94787.1 Adenosine monophosphate-protein transferase SoFic [Botrimarina colliarenosi]